MPDKELYCTLSLFLFLSLRGSKWIALFIINVECVTKVNEICLCVCGVCVMMGVVGYCLLLALKRYQHVAQSQSTSHRLHTLPLYLLLLSLRFFASLLLLLSQTFIRFCSVLILCIFVVFFCFSSLKVQFSRSARILFVFSKPLESAFIMHLTLSSTAVSPPPPPALLLLSPFQFALAARPSLFCTHSLSSALHSHSPTAAAAITICSLPSVCPSHSC